MNNAAVNSDTANSNAAPSLTHLGLVSIGSLGIDKPGGSARVSVKIDTARTRYEYFYRRDELFGYELEWNFPSTVDQQATHAWANLYRRIPAASDPELLAV